MKELPEICRYGDMKLKANRLEEKAKSIRKAVNNMTHLRHYSDSQINLYNNNEKLRIGKEYLRIASGEYELFQNEKIDVIRKFATAGDPLCDVIYDHINEMGYPLGELTIGESNIPEKMLNRTMTEKEYNGILSGELSFSSYPFDYSYLLKD